jgi:hypothetical protein
MSTDLCYDDFFNREVTMTDEEKAIDKELLDIFREMGRKMKSLEPELRALVYENLGDLYEE